MMQPTATLLATEIIDAGNIQILYVYIYLALKQKRIVCTQWSHRVYGWPKRSANIFLRTLHNDTMHNISWALVFGAIQISYHSILELREPPPFSRQL